MKTGNTRGDFTGRVLAIGKGRGARAVNWDNPYTRPKRKASLPAKHIEHKKVVKSSITKAPHVPESESVDFAPDMKYSRYAGSDFGALGDR